MVEISYIILWYLQTALENVWLWQWKQRWAENSFDSFMHWTKFSHYNETHPNFPYELIDVPLSS